MAELTTVGQIISPFFFWGGEFVTKKRLYWLYVRRTGLLVFIVCFQNSSRILVATSVKISRGGKTSDCSNSEQESSNCEMMIVLLVAGIVWKDGGTAAFLNLNIYRVIRNDCRGFNNLPPRSPDENPCDFFLWGYVKDQVYVRPLPASIPELKVVTCYKQFGTNSIIALMFV